MYLRISAVPRSHAENEVNQLFLILVLSNTLSANKSQVNSYDVSIGRITTRTTCVAKLKTHEFSSCSILWSSAKSGEPSSNATTQLPWLVRIAVTAIMVEEEILILIEASASYARNNQDKSPRDTEAVTSTIKTLSLETHPEGGYFHQTDRDSLLIPNPFLNDPPLPNASAGTPINGDNKYRNASTTIHYYLSPGSPIGHFHRNKARTVHTIHWGRGRYVLIHADQKSAKVETFVVGTNVLQGEVTQWIVDGGKFKSSFLLPDSGSDESQRGLLISETVVPGFDFCDHDFLTMQQMRELVGDDGVDGMGWMLGKAERAKLGLK